MSIKRIRERSLRIDERSREEENQGRAGFNVVIFDTLLRENLLGHIEWHWHRELQLCLVTSGKVTFFVSGSSYVIPEGEAIFINSGHLHSARSSGGDDDAFLCLDFPPELVSVWPGSVFETEYCSPFIKEGPAAVIFRLDDPRQAEIIKKLSAFLFSEDKSAPHEYRILIDILGIWADMMANITVQSGERTARIDDICPLIIGYIHEHWDEQIALCDIAAHVSLSPNECCRRFRKSLGQTIFSYLKEYRVRRSAEMLESTSLPVSDIAYRCGFCGSSYFIRSFREMNGITPLQYRREHGR